MNLIIKLPPKAERDEIVDSWVNGIIRQDYSEFHKVMSSLVNSGFAHNGIACLFLHESTTKMIQYKLLKLRDSEWIHAAFAEPISLN